MLIGIIKESNTFEKRVAAVPETVAKLVKSNHNVLLEKEAGLSAFFKDVSYETAGAALAADKKSVLQAADVIFKVLKLDEHNHEIDGLKNKAVLIGPLFLSKTPALVKKINEKQITTFALELLPRIARAQSMDILSSMSNLAGYKSVLLATDFLPKIFPMMTTAAGTLTPAKVIVIGAGVAGLQAIATARRLGASVIGFDTRPVTEEQVKSLGADFVSMAVTHDAEDAGGYAKEQTAEFYAKEQAILSEYTKEADVIITTALIPGKRAPILITEEMVKAMKPGSVVVDLAAEQGGNCALSEPGIVLVKHDVTMVALLNLPSLIPMHASQLYAKNIFNFFNYIAPQLTTQFDLTDDIIKSCLMTHGGESIHPSLKQNV